MKGPVTAVFLISASLLLGLVRLPWELAPSLFAFLVAVPTFLFMGLIAWQIYCGKKWARVVFTVLFVLGLPLSILPLGEALQSRPFSGILGILQLVSQTSAMTLLWLPGSQPWFHR